MTKEVRRGWIKWRDTWSHGNDGNWKYEEVVLPFIKKDADLYKRDFAEQFDYSAHFRGIELKRIKHPPLQVLRDMAHRNENNSKWLLIEAKRWREQIKLLTSKGKNK